MYPPPRRSCSWFGFSVCQQDYGKTFWSRSESRANKHYFSLWLTLRDKAFGLGRCLRSPSVLLINNVFDQFSAKISDLEVQYSLVVTADL